MGFYYFSVLSIFPLGIAYGLLGVLFWRISWTIREVSYKGPVLIAIGALFLVLPVSEELWIAWNFGQACKGSGTTIQRRVGVDGFYDDTTHWWSQLAKSDYRFVESRDSLTNALWRVERNGDQIKHFRIDRPTAKYHFRLTDRMNDPHWAHKVIRSGAVVFDSESKEEIARYTSFGRSAPWFYIGLGIPSFACDAPGRWPRTQSGHLIYKEVLVPAENR